MICGNEHMPKKCAELHEPLRDGFYSGGEAGHSHGEEDSKNGFKKLKIIVYYPQTKIKLTTQNALLRV
jgi:hypothetical protein